MPIILRAPLILFFIGAAAAAAFGQAAKEFQTSEGLARITAVPFSSGEIGGASGSDSSRAPVTGFSLDTLTEIAVLADVDGRFDPLVDVYFQDHLTGAELRFPAKLSQLRAFLAAHADRYSGGTPDSRSVAVIRDLSRELGVQMRSSDPGGAK